SRGGPLDSLPPPPPRPPFPPPSRTVARSSARSARARGGGRSAGIIARFRARPADRVRPCVRPLPGPRAVRRLGDARRGPRLRPARLRERRERAHGRDLPLDLRRASARLAAPAPPRRRAAVPERIPRNRPARAPDRRADGADPARRRAHAGHARDPVLLHLPVLHRPRGGPPGRRALHVAPWALARGRVRGARARA